MRNVQLTQCTSNLKGGCPVKLIITLSYATFFSDIIYEGELPHLLDIQKRREAAID